MAFSDGSQYHDWIRQQKNFPKKTLVYLVLYVLLIMTTPRVRQPPTKKHVPSPPTKIEMWGEVPKIPQRGAGIPSWEASRLIPQATTPRLQGGFAAVAFRRDSGRSTIPQSWNFADLPRWELEKPIWVIGYDVHQ